MFKERKQSLVVLLALVLALGLVLGKTPAFAANVSNFNELKAAVETSGEINLTQNIDVTETLVINNTVSISGGSKFTLKWVPADRLDQKGDQMFKVNEEKSLTLKDITLDGNNQGRLINVIGGTVNLTNATLQNGSTEKLGQNAKGDQNFSGGAILATKGEKLGSTVTITGGKFLNNNTGTVKSNDEEKNYRYRAAEGGAIKIEDSTLKINNADTTDKATTTFTGNHLDHWETGGGRQGGSIEATRSKVEIYGATFDVPGPFNTGGAIKFEDCKDPEDPKFEKENNQWAIVKNCRFTLDKNKGQFGVAGGAITSEGSTLKIEKSDFQAAGGMRVREAGGLIQVVGKGTFDLIGSNLEGAGAWWNGGRYTANTGGAISFYDGCSVTAKITDTTIKNFMVDGNGAGIALSKGNGHSSEVNLTLKNTTIENTAAYTWDGNSYAGGMYIGEGNTVKIDGGKISSQTASYVVGGIYNMGDLEITGGAQITGNFAYKMVGGIYHEGKRLKLDKVDFSGNKVGDSGKANHMIEGKEKGGINVYAKKDVIITPEATFDGNDVRVINGESAILLTGAPKKINVSISEKEKSTELTKAHEKIFEEDQHRKVGYVVAKGEGTYKPTADDAKKIHYVSNDTTQATAGPDDDKSIGQWDFVLNPETKDIVLGQRAELIFDGNGGTFNGQVTATKNYTFYSSEDPFADKTDMKAEKTPAKEGYQFVGWAKDKQVAFDSADAYLGAQVKKFDDSKSYMSLQENQTGPITAILNPHTKTVYALWVKQIDIPVKKVWSQGTTEAQKQPVELMLTGGTASASLTLNETNKWSGKFEKVDAIAVNGGTDGKDAKITNYSVSEVSIDGFTSETTGNATEGFTVTNTPTPETVDISVKKAWQDENGNKTTPTGVTATIKLLADGVDTKQALTFTDNGTQTFENLPKKNDQGAVIAYTISEETVSGYEKGVVTGNATDGFTVTNKKVAPTPEDKINIQVTKVWSGAEESDKTPVTITLKANDKATKETITLNAENQWTASFEGLAKKDESGKVINYTVSENAIEGFTSKVTGNVTDGFIVTNTKVKPTPPAPEEKVNIKVMKVWFGAEESDKVPVTITLKANGDATNETVTLNAENQWTAAFKDLAEKDENGKIAYTVKENDVKGFTSKVTGDVANGFTVTNTKINPIPEDKVNVQVTKVWSGAEENDKVPVTITLKANGEVTDKTITLNADNKWTATFEGLAKNDEKGNAITYTVSENAVQGFTSKVTGDMHDGFTVTNTKDKPTRRPNGNGGRTETTPSGNTPTEPSKGLKTQDHYQYMFGYPDYSFQQDGFMTRAEIAAMVARIIDDKPDLNRHYPSNFTDMKDSAWYDDAVGYIVDKKIMTGYPDGSFKPNAPITRAEYAQVVSKFRTLTGTDGMTFSDVPNAHWAHDAILGIATGGWVKGYPDGSFKPERFITRAEIVTITNAMLNREADKTFVDNHVGDMIHWIDLEKSHWAYYGIREATHGHDYKRVGDREEEWQRLNGLKFEFPEAHYEGGQR